MNLKDFTPAQVLMLTSPIGVAGKNLMKYSFLDLIYNGYLKVYRDWRLPHPRDNRERLYTFVSRGDRFNDYVTNFHQDPFIEPFIEDDYEYQVRSLLKKVYNECGKGHGFKTKNVYSELARQGYFTTSLGLKYINLYFRTSRGSKLGEGFTKKLKEADKNLPLAAKNNPEDARKIVNDLGSNVLLLDNFNDELIESLKPIFEQTGKTTSSLSDGHLGRLDAFEFLFYSFLDTLDHFDASFDSFDTSFDFSDSGSIDFDAGGFDVGDY